VDDTQRSQWPFDKIDYAEPSQDKIIQHVTTKTGTYGFIYGSSLASPKRAGCFRCQEVLHFYQVEKSHIGPLKES